MPDDLTGGLVSWDSPVVTPPVQNQTEVERTTLPTETAFLNSALAFCGCSTISSIDDETTEARKCRDIYPPLLDANLRLNHWKFAEARSQLALGQSPSFGLRYSFPLPADWLKMREFNGYHIDISMSSPEYWYSNMCIYKVAGRSLLTNYAQAYILYTRRVTDPSQWDASFYKYMQYILASELALAIPKNSKLSGEHFEKAQIFLLQATQIDGQEESGRPFIVDNLTRGR